MQPRGLTGRLAGLSARNPWKIVIVWIVLFVAAGVVSALFPASFTTDASFTNDPESLVGDELLESAFVSEGNPEPDEYIIVKSDSGLTVDDPAFQTYVTGLTDELRAMTGNVAMVTNFYESGEELFVSDNRQATVLPVGFVDDEDTDSIHAYLDLVDEQDETSGYTVVTGGQPSIDNVFIETSESDLQTGETIGISIAIIVLVVVFGTLVAAGVPLVLAITSIAMAFGITMIVGNAFELSIFVVNMIVMIGLAVGIDYALFIVGRFREERRKGLDTYASVLRTGETASKAVLFSGLTVVTALVGMLLVPSTIFQSLGAGSIIVVVVSMLATLTLLPAALQLLGAKLERGRERWLMFALGITLLLFAGVFQALSVDALFSVAYVVLALISFVFAVLNVDPFERVRSTGDGSLWARISRFVMKYPAPLAAVTTIALLAVGSIYFTINLGQSGISTMPHDSSPYRAFTLLGSEFSQISLEEPNHVVVQAADVNAPEVQGAIDTLISEAAQDEQLGPAQVTVNEDGTVASVAFPSLSDTQSGAALASMERMRDDYVPTAFNGVAADVYVTGPSAFTVDFNSIVDTYTPIVFAFVLGVSLLLLLLAFRSLVVPIKSVIMNLLSVGASYGLLVLVFQHGYGHELLGFQKVERIDAWVPLMMFTILFGLSMDYHVFLLSRIKERYDLTRNNTESVAYGVRTTANIITGAALIMVAVFGGFAMGELAMFQQMGFGLAVAVVLDATIIRSVLVPATMRLLGDWNWYYPSWLEWLPKINVEGVEELPAPAPAPAGVPAD